MSEGPSPEAPHAAAQPAAPQPVATRMCIVRLGDRLFAIPGHYSKGIVPVGPYTPVPRTPPHLLGVTNVRGTFLPLLDLRAPLGQVAKVGGQDAPMVLLLEVEGVAIALYLQEVVGFDPIARGTAAPLTSADPIALRTYGLGLIHYRSEPVVLLDIEKLLAALVIRDPLRPPDSDAS